MTAPAGDVADRLERVAVDAPAGRLDADHLWSRGRRRQRRRSVATLAAVVVVGLLGTAMVPRLLAGVQSVDPASSDSMVLPDLLREPGGWEPAFPDVPGRLSAVGFGTRSGLWSDRPAWWGVSAATGESRFLDLPLAPASVDTPALSADGRRLAYWMTGEVPGTPMDANGGRGDDAVPVVGVAVLDLVTGARRTWPVSSEHGLATGQLAWAGDVLWWSAGRLVPDGATGVRGEGITTSTWDLARDLHASAPRRLDGFGVDGGPAPGGFLTTTTTGVAQVTGADATPLRLALPSSTPEDAGWSGPTLSPGGTRVAALLVPDTAVVDDAPKQLFSGAVDGRRADLSAVPDVEAAEVLGWRSDREVVTASLADVEDGRPWTLLQASAVDVGTGESTVLVTYVGNTPEVADDAWAAEVVPAPDAPFAPDPRLVGLVLLGGALGSWWLFRAVRRRRAGS